MVGGGGGQGIIYRWVWGSQHVFRDHQKLSFPIAVLKVSSAEFGQHILPLNSGEGYLCGDHKGERVR